MSPTTPLQHRREAERMLTLVWKKNAEGEAAYSHEMRMEILAKARVHAMLANDGFVMQEEP